MLNHRKQSDHKYRQVLPQLFTVKQMAEILSISKSFAYKLVAVGEIPHVKVGTAIRIRYEDLLKYINGNMDPMYNPVK